MILQRDKVVQLHLDLFSSGNLAHFYLEWRKSNQNGTKYERNGKKSN